MTAEATEAQVAAAEAALRCARVSVLGRVTCWAHSDSWTDRGCPVAVAVADAVMAPGPDPATIAADEWRTAQNVNHLRATIRTGWPALAKALNDWHEAQS